MTFEAWLTECRSILMRTLNFDETEARAMIAGAGDTIYRRKFDAGMTPQQSVDDELMAWNE